MQAKMIHRTLQRLRMAWSFTGRQISLLCALFLALLGWWCPSPALAAGAIVVTEQARAELLVHAPQGLAAGRPAWLGLKIEHRPGWHTYWLNPGDSGLPTSLQWQLPAGMKAGEIQWPVPERLPIGPLMNHGYEGVLLLPVPLSIEGTPGPSGLRIALRADWLICKDVCIPEGGDFELTLPAGAALSSIVGSRVLFEQALARLPIEPEGLKGAAQVQAQGLALDLSGLPSAWQGKRLALFPETPHILAPAAEPAATWKEGGAWSGLLAYSPQRMESPTRLHFVIAPADHAVAALGPPGVRVAVEIKGAWSAAQAASEAPAGQISNPGAGEATAPIGSNSTGAAPSFWLSLLMALLGGAILNLMPCVFPVLSLKAFGFAQHATDRRALAVGGMAYTAGVVLSFAALAGLLLALRASGEQLGWGFQLQSPLFVAALALLFTLMGLNLLGLFEFTVPLPGRLAGAQASHPIVDQALTGVLAVVVASPCTAPFMGASLGAAVTMPTAQALLVFVALGLGMALPYLLLCLVPALAARLPRPGSWMLHFKHAMALPMMATVIWLLWVLGHQAGVDAVAGLLGVLLVAAFAIGAWRLPLSGSGALGALRVAAIAAVAATAAWAWPSLQVADDAASSASASPGSTATLQPTPTALPDPASGIHPNTWLPWSPAAVAQAHAQGRTVFVDYTAAWCVTCQVNKRSTLRDAQVLKALGERGIVLMRADWTRRDAAITAELTRLGRTGVPVYAFYAPGSAPILLPELLTPQMVIEAVSAWPMR